MQLSDLKTRKNNLKLTVGQLAVLADLPVGTVSKIMTGETQNPSFLTVDILDRTLAKAEMEARIIAYRNAMAKYIEEHPDEDVIYKDFERQYRKQNRLNNKAIPYATPDDDPYWISGDLALNNPLTETKPDGYITYEEFRDMEESILNELIDGEVIVNQAPSVQHHVIVKNINKAIDGYINRNHGSCHVFDTGVGVRFLDDKDTYLIPDILITCNPENIKEEYILTPDWVIEVTSPSTRKLDYQDKMNKYLKNGVREYWIVDLKKKTTIVYINEGEDDISIYGFNEEIPVYIYNGDLKLKMDDYINL